MAFLTASLLAALIDMQMLATFPLHIVSIGFAPRVYGMLISLNGVLIIALELVIINDTHGCRRARSSRSDICCGDSASR